MNKSKPAKSGGLFGNKLVDSDGRPKLPYDPKINRWTGKPHEHKREIARSQKQG